MNVGSYIFSQVVDYIPRYQFDKLVAKYHGNWHSKDLTCITSCCICCSASFRRWATQRLHEYIQKGFTMDDERLKQGGNRYFEELAVGTDSALGE